jgi:hypothetical protein
MNVPVFSNWIVIIEKKVSVNFSFIFHKKIVIPEGRLQSRLNADLALPPVNEFVNMYKPVEVKNFDYFEFARQLKFLLNR